jgi:hypothetical protein
MPSMFFVQQSTQTSPLFADDDFSLLPTAAFLMEVSSVNVIALTPVKCDAKGNVWAGCGDGIHVWSEALFTTNGYSLMVRLGGLAHWKDVSHYSSGML